MFWCICMCMHAYICVCMHGSMDIYKHVHVFSYVHWCVCACMRVCAFLQYPSTSIEVGIAGFPPPPPPQYWKASYAHEPSSNSWVTVWNTKLFYFHSLKWERVQRSATDTLKYHIWPRTPHPEVIKHNKSPHTREPRGQPFPSRWPQDCNK